MFEQFIKTLEKMDKTVDIQWFMQHSKALIELEDPQTFPAYHRAAKYVYDLLQQEGFAPEMLTFKADGKTVYQDMRTPLAWDASVGRLTVLQSPVPFADPIIADYEKMPYALVKHSVSTPEGGLRVPVLTEAQVYAGEDCTDALVLLETGTRPRPPAIIPLLDLGALGFISDNIVGADDTPDCTQWVNAGTDDDHHWHVQAEDRDFIGFSIKPRVGRQLRNAVSTGTVEVLVESDGRRYEDEIHAVTALIPGKDPRELWLIAHLYEPLSNDNSSSVICAIEMVRSIRRLIEAGELPQLQFSIRLAFAMECYGYSAMADYYGGNISHRVIGGLNMDCLPMGATDDKYFIHLTPHSAPFFGNYMMEEVFKAYDEYYRVENAVADWQTSYSDDSFMSDSRIGLPVIQVESWTDGCNYWHNSVRNFDDLCADKCHRVTCAMAAWAARVTTVSEKELPAILEMSAKYAQARLDLEAERNSGVYADEDCRMESFRQTEYRRLRDYKKVADIPQITQVAERLNISVNPGERVFFDGPWSAYADGMICSRVGDGIPFDMIRKPKRERRQIVDRLIYGPVAAVLSGMDGKKSLLQLIKEAAWEYHVERDEKDVRDYVNGMYYLAESGYITIENENEIDRDAIISVLRELGIQSGDTLLVHGSQSACGHVVGGADEIISAFVDVVGVEGTVLMPSFTRPYIGFDGVTNKGRNFRPFTPGNTENIWTGTLPKKMAMRKDALRSAHATHSWCGVGKNAAYCLESQTLLDAPANDNSPMAKALELGGKVVFFGCGVGSNTFLHYLETKADADFLESAVIQVLTSRNRRCTEVIHQHLPGHRDFYGPIGLKAKFYQKAFKKGLVVREVKLGTGSVFCMDLQQLYTIGMELFREDPNITLCDNPDCRFCRSFNK